MRQWVAIEILWETGKMEIGEAVGPFPDENAAVDFYGEERRKGRDFIVVPLSEGGEGG